MSDEIKKILDKLNKLEYDDIHLIICEVISRREIKILLDYITNLQQENKQLEKNADSRMKTLLKIEQYCIDEKEDLICGGEVCEDVLKIIDELKGE